MNVALIMHVVQSLQDLLHNDEDVLLGDVGDLRLLVGEWVLLYAAAHEVSEVLLHVFEDYH